jgi:hypothetical protein
MVAVKIKDSVTLEETIRVLAAAVKKAEEIGSHRTSPSATSAAT